MPVFADDGNFLAKMLKVRDRERNDDAWGFGGNDGGEREEGLGNEVEERARSLGLWFTVAVNIVCVRRGVLSEMALDYLCCTVSSRVGCGVEAWGDGTGLVVFTYNSR